MKFEHNNISPLDSRYAEKIVPIREAFSEKALIKTRFIIEINWLLFLCNKMPNDFPKLSKISINKILKFRESFSDKDVIKIKKIESVTNHDVKAIEYFIVDFFKRDKQLKKYINLIHYGLTSEDINSLSYAIMIKKGAEDYLKYIQNLNKVIKSLSRKWKSIPLLSRTHGQAASPTTIGKELKVFGARIDREVNTFKNIKPLAKFSGATGNYHTFEITNNKIDWPTMTSKFIKSFGVNQNPLTTQIESHDWIAEMSHSIIRINNISTDLCQDMWIYISNNIFKLKLNKNEVGSSTMPHKVNPIDFENAEGNLGLSNALFSHLSEKLPVSRLQRDLSDSTVLRSIGSAYGYFELSVNSLLKGLNKLEANRAIIGKELDGKYEILTEAIQTFLRLEGVVEPYEKVKKISRGNAMDKETYLKIIDELIVDKSHKKTLKNLTPQTYVGIAEELAKL